MGGEGGVVGKRGRGFGSEGDGIPDNTIQTPRDNGMDLSTHNHGTSERNGAGARRDATPSRRQRCVSEAA